MNEKGLTVQNTSAQTAVGNLLKFDTIDAMIAFGSKIAKSGLSPLKKGEDIAVAIMIGADLGISITQAIQNIFSIDGKAGFSVHLLKGLLLKAGIYSEVIHEYTPLYIYKGVSGVLFTQEDVDAQPEAFQLIYGSTPKDQWIKGKEQIVRGLKPVDYLCEIKFTRQILLADNTWKTIERTVKRKHSDYSHLHTKTNWKNSPKDMLSARVYAIGSRDVGPDTMLGGMYLADELANGEQMPTVQTQTSTVDIEGIIIEPEKAQNGDNVEIKEEELPEEKEIILEPNEVNAEQGSELGNTSNEKTSEN